jgi:transposase-like protein
MITCPHCHSKHINKNGKKPTGTQNYLCRNSSCSKQFQLIYKNQAANPVVKNYVE